jgi:hypothetical protein
VTVRRMLEQEIEERRLLEAKLRLMATTDGPARPCTGRSRTVVTARG